MKTTETFTAYVTQYALSNGIEEVQAEKCSADTMIKYRLNGHTCYAHKPQWHLSMEDAQVKAESMRTRKIDSLKRQISKLEALKF